MATVLATAATEDEARLAVERELLAAQGARDRELIQALTTQRDAALALVREVTDAVFLGTDINGLPVLYWRGLVADWLTRARALLAGAK